MVRSLRGRPRLNIDFKAIIDAVQRHRQIVAAARELGCSDAYIHERLRQNGFTLKQVLEKQQSTLNIGSLCSRCGFD